MTRIRKRTVRCAVCRRESLHSVILSTNSFGSKDLDFRPPGMMRRTLPLWIQECPHCGYVNTDISEKMPITPKILNELRNIDLEENNLNIISAIRFYKLYFLKNRLFDLSNKSPDDCSLLVEAFYAVLHAAWICDDKREKKDAIIYRQKALELLDELQLIYSQSCILFPEDFSLDGFLIIKADLMRRAGLFERLRLEFERMSPFSDPFLNKVIRFHINRAKAGDTRRYTFDYVDSNLWERNN